MQGSGCCAEGVKHGSICGLSQTRLSAKAQQMQPNTVTSSYVKQKYNVSHYHMYLSQPGKISARSHLLVSAEAVEQVEDPQPLISRVGSG